MNYIILFLSRNWDTRMTMLCNVCYFENEDEAHGRESKYQTCHNGKEPSLVIYIIAVIKYFLTCIRKKKNNEIQK